MATKRMNYGFSSEVGYACFLGSCVVTKADNDVIDGNPSAELLCVFSEMNSKKPGLVSAAQLMSVLVVFGARCNSKVVKAVIRSISIYMVYFTIRETPHTIKESKPVRSVGFSINSDRNVPAAVKVPGSAANFGAEGCYLDPPKHSSIRAIVQQLTQSLSGNICRIFDSHDAPPVRWDQRRGRVSSACLALSC